LFKPLFVLSLSKFSFFPVVPTISSLGLLLSSVFWWHTGRSIECFFFFVFLSYSSTEWWRELRMDVSAGFIPETNNQFRFSMVLFILSEVMFFFSFFWGFFHACFVSVPEIGCYWPPADFDQLSVDGFSVPFLNTCLLLSSGVTVTWAHKKLMLHPSSKFSAFPLGVTVVLGFVFLLLQVFEYSVSSLSINRTVFGSRFFLLTGFHGAHVTIGAVFLRYCLIQVYFKKNYSSDFLTRFECASWYWHFVDVVWLFLFIFVYLYFG